MMKRNKLTRVISALIAVVMALGMGSMPTIALAETQPAQVHSRASVNLSGDVYVPMSMQTRASSGTLKVIIVPAEAATITSTNPAPYTWRSPNIVSPSPVTVTFSNPGKYAYRDYDTNNIYPYAEEMQIKLNNLDHGVATDGTVKLLAITGGCNYVVTLYFVERVRANPPTFTGIDKVYDGLTATIGVEGKDTKDIIEYMLPDGTWTTTAPIYKDVVDRTVQIRVTNRDLSFYPYTTSVQVKIAPRPVEAKVADLSIRVGEALPEARQMELSIANAIDGDVNAIISAIRQSGSFSVTVPNNANNTPGQHTMTLNGPASVGNYAITYRPGVLTVISTVRPSTPKVNTVNKTYDGQTSAMSVDNLIDGDVVSYRTIGGEWTTVPPSYTDVTTQVIEVKVENPGYTAFEQIVANQVIRRSITAQAADYTMEVGQTLPAANTMPLAITGAVAADVDSIVGGIRTGAGFSITSNAPWNAGVGSYTLTLTGPAQLQNYSITYIPGKLTLTAGTRPSTPVVHRVDKVYDGATSAMSVTGLLGGDVVEYRVSGGSWTTTPPAYKDVQAQTVEVRVTNESYKPYTETVTNQVTRANAYVRVSDLTLAVGEAFPAIADIPLSITGAALGDADTVRSQVRSGVGFSITSPGMQESAGAGTYALNITGPAQIQNYNVFYTDGLLTREHRDRPSTPMIHAVDKVYDGNTYAMSATNLIDGDVVEYNTGSGVWTNVAPTYQNVQTQVVEVRVTNPKYTTYTQSVTNRITPRPVIVRPEDLALPVGANIPNLQNHPLVITGAVAGQVDELKEYIRVIEGFSVTTDATSSSPEGSYAITVKGVTAVGNYTVQYETGTLTLAKAARPESTKPKFTGVNKVYDAETSAITSSGGDAEDVIRYETAPFSGEWTETIPTFKDAMDAPQTVRVQVSNRKYETYIDTVSNMVTRRPLVVSVGEASRAYGKPNPAVSTLTLTLSGHVASEMAAVEQAVRASNGFGITIQATETTPVGTAPILVTGAGTIPNYTVTYEPGILRITKGIRTEEDNNTPIITPVNKVYDGTASTIRVDRTLEDDTIQYRVDGKLQDASPEYLSAMDMAQAVEVVVTNPNYEPYTKTVNNQVTRRAITARVNDASRPYGQPNPQAADLVITLIGVVAGENALVEGQIRTGAGFGITSTATETSRPSGYPLTITGPALIPNYTVNYEPGTLTVTTNTRPADTLPEIIPVNKPYDGITEQVQVVTKDPDDKVEYLVDGKWVTDAPSYRDAMEGADTVEIRVTNPKYEDYTGSATSQVTHAQLVVRADDKTRAYGEPTPTATVTLSGPVAGEIDTLTEAIYSAPGFALQVKDNPNAQAGSMLPIEVTGPARWGNYDVTYENGTLAVERAARPAEQMPVATGVNTVYDGRYHYIDVKNITPQDNVEYLVDGVWTVVSPAFYDYTPAAVDIRVRVTNPNYLPVELDTVNTIHRAAMTVTADDKRAAYGQAFPQETFALSGPVPGDYGEMRLALLGDSRFSVKAEPYPNAPAGTRIPIRIAGPDVLGNYTLTYVPGELLIEKARREGDMLPKVTAVNTTYDGQNHIILVENTLPDDMVEYLRPDGQWTTEAPVYHDAADAELVRVRVSNDNYLPYETITVNQVKRAGLVVTADNKSRAYGEANPVLTISLQGPIQAEYTALEALLRADSAFSLTAEENPGAATGSELPIHVTGPRQLPNYTVTYVDGVLSVGKTDRPASEIPAVTAVWQPYDGKTHTIGIAGGHADDIVEYSYGTGGWTRTAPAYLNAMDAPQKVIVRFTNPAYAPYQVETNNQIFRAQAVATADDKVRKYGEENPLFTFSLTGAVDGEEALLRALIRTSGQYYIGANADALTPVQDGIAIVLRGGANLGNYTVRYVDGSLSIIKGDRPASLMPDIYGVDKEYDGQTHQVQVDKKDDDDVIEFYYDGKWQVEPPTYLGAMDTPDDVPVRITSPRYETYEDTVSSQITRAALKVSADNKSMPVGGPVPELTISVAGKLASELEALKAEILGHAQFSIMADADASTPAGTAPITVKGPDTLANYTVTYADGILSIGKAERPVGNLPTIVPVNRVYDGESHTIRVSNLLTGDKVEYSADGTGWSETYPVYRNAMDAPEIIWVRVTNDAYTPYQAKTSNQIRRAHLYATPNDATRAYGTANPAFTYDITEAIAGEENAVRSAIEGDTRFYLGTDATESTHAGTWPITMRGPLQLQNYHVTYGSATLTITKAKRPASLMPEIQDIDRIYDGQSHALVVNTKDKWDTAEYFYDGQWQTDPPTYLDAMDAAQTVPVRVLNPNYEDFAGEGSAYIRRAQLTVTAQNASRGYGEANPAFDITVSGPVQRELSSLKAEIKGHAQYAIGSTADAATPSGQEVPITVKGPAQLANYDVTYLPGILSVGKTPRPAENTPAITGVDTVYDGKDHYIAVSDLLPDDVVKYSLPDGSYTETPPVYRNALDAADTVIVRVENPNYEPYQVETKNMVTRKEIQAVADDKSRPFGAMNPAFTYTVHGAVDGEEQAVRDAIRASGTFYLDTDANTTTPVGTAAITFRSIPQLANYTIAYVPGILTITGGGVRPDGLKPDITVPNGPYDGEEHTVVVVPKDPDDVVEYYYDNGWHDTPPIYKDAMEAPESLPIRVTNPKYEPLEETVNPYIWRAALTVRADDKSREFGAPNPDWTITVSGPVQKELEMLHGQLLADSRLQVTMPNQPDAPAGSSLPITITGPNPYGNYDVTYEEGTLHIGRAVRPPEKEPTITPVDAVYDAENHYIGVTNKLPGDVVSYRTENGTYTTVAPVFRDYTPEPVKVWVRVTNPDYAPYEVETYNTIRRATITVKADDKAVPYGQAFPKATFTLTGPVPADLVTMQLALLQRSDFSIAIDPATDPQAGDTFPIRVNGPAALDNYNLLYENGTLTVEKAKRMGDMLPKVTGVDVTYDAENHTILVENTLPDDTIMYLVPGGSWTEEAPVYHDAEAAELVRVRVENPNYLDYETSTVNQVRRAKLAVTADNKSRPYGTANPPLTITLDGPIPAEYTALEAALRADSAFSLTAAEEPAASVGTEIPIIVEGPLQLPNYDVTYVGGVLSVGKTQRPTDQLPAVTAVQTPYTGQTHLIGITGQLPDDTIEYSYGGSGWTRIAPTYVNAMDAAQKVTVRFTNPNYEPYQVETSNLVWHAPAVAKANDATRKYGQANPPFTFTITGAVAGEEDMLRAMIRASGQFYLGANADANTPVQDGIAIVLRGERRLGNYAITYENGALSITKGDRPNSLMPDIHGVNQEYDGQEHPVNVIKKDSDDTVEYFYDGKWQTDPPAYTDAMDAPESVPVRITNPRYEDFNGEVISQITHAKLTVSADNKSKLFGAPNPAFTITVSGKLPGELAALKQEILAHQAFTIGAEADETTPAGEVAIAVAGPGKLTNYTVEYVNGILSIGKAERPETLLPVVTPVDRAYDGKTHTILVEGTLQGDVVEFSDGNGWVKASPAYRNAMEAYETIWVRVTNPNYAPYQVETRNQIRRAYVLATAKNETRRFGEANPAFAFTFTGAVPGEEAEVRGAITGSAQFGLDTDARERTPVGQYKIELRGPAYLRNYTVAYVSGTLTITRAERPANLMPDVEDINQPYDGVDHPLQVTVKDPDDETEYYYDGQWQTDPPTYKDAMDAPEKVPVRVTNPNYEPHETEGSAQITRAKLMVKADSASRGYGEINPALDFQVSGPVSWELADLKAEIKNHAAYRLYTLADASTPSGSTVPITVEGPGTLRNYDVFYYEGTLSVGIAQRPDDAIPTVEGFDTVYDGQPHGIQVDNLLPDDVVKYSDGYGGWTTEAPTYTNAMEAPESIVVRVENGNYAPFEKEVSVNISRRPAVAKAVDASRRYGESNPAFAIALQNVVLGEEARVEGLIRSNAAHFYLDTDATPLTAPGTATITLTGPRQIPNYTLAYEDGVLTITKGGKRPDGLKPDITAPDGEYDGEYHPIEVDVKDPDDEVEYYYDEKWQKEPPTYKDAMDEPEEVPVRVTNPKYEDYEEDAKPYIRRAKLTVLAQSKSRAYGESDPAFTLALSGPVTSEYAALEMAIRADGAFALSAPDSKLDTPAGSEVDIIVKGPAQLPNYDVGYVNGRLSIGKTARPENQLPVVTPVNKVYDGVPQAITADNLLEGDVVTYSTGGGWTGEAPTYRNAMSTPDVVIVRVENPRYEPYEVRTENQVTHAPIIAAAEDKQRPYGAQNPELTFVLEGAVVPGEEQGVKDEMRARTGQFVLSTQANTMTPVGTADITFTGPAQLTNYTVTYRGAILTITKASRPNNPWVEGLDDTVYDGEDHEVIIGGTTPDDKVSWSDDGGDTWHEGNPPPYHDANEDDPNKEIIVKIENENYEDFVSEPVPVEVKRAKLTVMADSKQRAYGEENPALTYTLGGPIPAEYPQLRTELEAGGLALATEADAATPAGTEMAITAKGPEKLKNYTVDYVDGILAIGKTARPADKQIQVIPVDTVYDGKTHVILVENTITGEDVVEFKVRDGGWMQASPEYLRAMDPEAVTVRVTNPNYETYQTLVSNIIRRAPLTVTAEDMARRYGEKNPAFTIVLGGTVDKAGEADQVESEIRSSGEFRLTTQATLQTPAGTTAPIEVRGPKQITNYTVTYADGTLTITTGKRPEEIVVDGIDDGTIYDGKEHEVTIDGTLPDDKVSWSDDGGNTWHEGEPPTYIDATGENEPKDIIVKVENDNYETVITDPVPVEIKRAKLSVRADDQRRKYREANPELTLTLEGAVRSEGPGLEKEIRAHAGFSLTTPANEETPAGSILPIVLTGPRQLKNYDLTYTNGWLSVLDASRPGDINVTGPGGREYDGEDHNVIIDGKLPGDKVSWSDDGGNTWHEGEPPAYQDATQDGEPKEIIVKVENPDYDDYISGPVSVEIVRRPLRVIANNAERMYGDANGAFAYALRNVVAKDETLVRRTLEASAGFSLTSTATVTTPAGTQWPIMAAGPQRLKNYAVTYESGILSIIKRPLRVVVEPVVIGQGQEFKDQLKVRFTVDENGKGGIANGDAQRIGVQYVLTATNPIPVGSHPLTVRLSNVSDYDVTIVPSTLTVLGQVNYTSNYPARYPANSPWTNATYVDGNTYAQGTGIILPGIAQTGFETRGLTFAGWELNGKVYAAGESVPMGTDKMVFKAIWTVNTYTLTVQHRVKGTDTAVAPDQKVQLAYGQSYEAFSIQHALYRAEKTSESGVMQDSDTTIVFYYTQASTGGDGNGNGNTGGNNGGNTGGGNTGGSTGGGNTGGSTGGGTGGGSVGGGSTGGATAGGQAQADGGTQLYAILDDDVPLGGITARNVGHCAD